MANLIQNYVNNINQGISSVNTTTKKYYNNLTDVDSGNLLAPLDGKGYLVENNLLTAPKEFAKDTYYTAKSLQRGITGKANDHELGKLNDLGLKLGGLSIAAYLMTKRQTPKAKAMEFIGFGSFLASMAIWPKVALQWPARLIHGVNFRKQYVDEQGRKKYLTQDPNYIPFDLMKGKHKSEDLDAIADRMGIAKDVKDRQDLAKEHVRKVSVQNNTLWMLTAGLATPIMTALMCNQIEKPLGRYFENKQNAKINDLAQSIDEYLQADSTAKKVYEDKLIAPRIDASSKTTLEDLLNAKKGSVLKATDITELSEALAHGLDTKTQKAARQDLSNMLVADKTLVNNDTVSEITKLLSERIDAKYGEGYSSTIIDAQKLDQHVVDFMSRKGNPANGVLHAKDAEELRLSLSDFVGDTLKDKKLSSPRQNTINSMAYDIIDDVFSRKKVAVLDDLAVSRISTAGDIIRRFRAFDETLSEATHFKVEKAAETVAGNNWGEVTETLVKELNISPKELSEAKASEELTAELFTRKLEDIAKDESRYKKLVQKISQKMEELDIKLDNPGTGRRPVMDILVDGIQRNCDSAATELNTFAENGQKPFYNLARRISTEEINGRSIGTLKDAKVSRITSDRVGGIKNAYMRLLHTIDFFKRAEDYSRGINVGFSGDEQLDKALIEKGKKLLMSSHSGDFFMKSQTGNNVNFYRALMWHIFGNDAMSQSTKDVLGTESHQVFSSGKSSMATRISRWAEHIYNLMGKSKYDFLPDHITENKNGVAPNLSNAERTAVEKFNQIACTPESLLHSALKQKYNSNKWMRTFSTLGGVVLAGTLASQFAFGKHDNTKQA